MQSMVRRDRVSVQPAAALVLPTMLRHTPLPPGCRCPCVQQVLTPIQTARVIVHSFPYFPNAREIATRMMMLRK